MKYVDILRIHRMNYDKKLKYQRTMIKFCALTKGTPYIALTLEAMRWLLGVFWRKIIMIWIGMTVKSTGECPWSNMSTRRTRIFSSGIPPLQIVCQHTKPPDTYIRVMVAICAFRKCHLWIVVQNLTHRITQSTPLKCLRLQKDGCHNFDSAVVFTSLKCN